ncbi:MAG: MarR family winged helix-turn-helix transcriptional regulator [Clostridia bacterium]
MGKPSEEFEDIVIKSYHDLLRVEAALLRKTEKLNITLSEMNIIGAIGRGGGCPTISEIGDSLSISLPSVTDGVNRMVKRGLVEKTRDEKDARIVRTSLTKEGRRLYCYQEYYLRSTVRAITADFTDDEIVLLRRAVLKINDVFKNILEKNTNSNQKEN